MRHPNPLRRPGQLGGGLRPSHNWAYKWGLVSHWPLDEASGNAQDAYGTNVLTDTNTVTQNWGKVHQYARQFTAANNEHFTIASNATLQTGNVDFWACGWAYIDSTVGTLPSLITKSDSSKDEYLLYYEPAVDRFRFAIYDGGSYHIQSADALGSPSLATWYFLLGWYDSVNDTINIRINNGTVNSLGTAGAFPAANTGAAWIGSYRGTSTDAWSGRIESVSFGKSPPGGIAGRIGEINTVLYNGGAGLSYFW